MDDALPAVQEVVGVVGGSAYEAIAYTAGVITAGGALGVIERAVVNNGGLMPDFFAVTGEMAAVMATRAAVITATTGIAVSVGSALDAAGGAALDQIGY